MVVPYLALSLMGWLRSWPARHPRTADAAPAFLGCALDLFVASDAFVALTSGDPRGALTVGYAVVGYSALLRRRQAPTLVLAAMLVQFLGAVLLLPDYRPSLGVLIV